MKEKFENLGELQNKVLNLDTARQEMVWYGPDKEDKKIAPKHKAIINNTTNQLSCVSSANYRLVQHNEIFKKFIDVVDGLNLSCFGWIDNQRDRVSVDLLFNNSTINDGKSNIHLGVRFINSYNKTTSFSGGLFAMRVACENGMVLSKALGAQFRQIHVGHEWKVERKIERFLKTAISSNNKLNELVSRALENSYEWELAEQFVGELIKRKKHRKHILNILSSVYGKGKDKVTTYDIYNSITQYCTHGEKLGVYVKDYLQNKAQEVLVQVPLRREK